jgi:hypothetical protein
VNALKPASCGAIALVAATALTVAGCGHPPHHAAASPTSTPISVPFPSPTPTTPVGPPGPPVPDPCPPLRSTSDLAGLGPDSDAVVEGTAPGATGTLFDFTEVDFHVDLVLQTRAGLIPAAEIRVLLGSPKVGLTMPAGRYLLFVQYNSLNDTYILTNGDTGEFQLADESSVRRACAPTTTAPNAVAPSPVAMSWSALETYAATVPLGPQR